MLNIKKIVDNLEGAHSEIGDFLNDNSDPELEELQEKIYDLLLRFDSLQ